MLQIYEGEVEPWLMSDYCTDTVPVLLRRATFCRAFAADAKDFRSYNSWVGNCGIHLAGRHILLSVWQSGL